MSALARLPGGRLRSSECLLINDLISQGRLGADKARLLDQVRQAISRPDQAPLRPNWARGL